MTTASLAALKKSYKITDEAIIKYEKKDDEIILHVPIKKNYSTNDDIILQARNLIKDRKEQGWSRYDFFADFMKVREIVLKQIREHYEQN